MDIACGHRSLWRMFFAMPRTEIMMAKRCCSAGYGLEIVCADLAKRAMCD